jgi:hypothetical protein
VDEVDDDCDLDTAVAGFGVDAIDLVIVSIDERDPRSGVGWVAALSLVEEPGDDLGGVVDHRSGQPLAGRYGCWDRLVIVVTCHDVGGTARGRGDVVDGTDLGHAFAAPFLALRQPDASLLFEPSAALRVAGRSASGRITMPLPSAESTSTSSTAPADGCRAV